MRFEGSWLIWSDNFRSTVVYSWVYSFDEDSIQPTREFSWGALFVHPERRNYSRGYIRYLSPDPGAEPLRPKTCLTCACTAGQSISASPEADANRDNHYPGK